MNLRSARESDVPAIQALYTESMPEPIPSAAIAVRDQDVRVIEDDNRALIGVRVLTKSAFVWAAVVPDQRRKGIGTRLIEDALQQAASLGLTELTAQIDDGSPAAAALGERFGFEPFLYGVTLALDLAHWDEAPLIPLLDQAQAAGIRFVTYADLGNTPEHQRQLYELNKALSATIPRDPPPQFAPFETYVQRRLLDPRMPNDGIWIALDGDQWIGMTQISFEDGHAFNQMTGVLPEYRGHGIAQALKLLSLRFAKQQGQQVIRTFNDVANTPMIAVNEKAGFHQTGRFHWARRSVIPTSKSNSK